MVVVVVTEGKWPAMKMRTSAVIRQYRGFKVNQIWFGIDHAKYGIGGMRLLGISRRIMVGRITKRDGKSVGMSN